MPTQAEIDAAVTALRGIAPDAAREDIVRAVLEAAEKIRDPLLALRERNRDLPPWEQFPG